MRPQGPAGAGFCGYNNIKNMRKQFTIFLILIFVLGLVPVNFSEAITQNQINSEVQIVCTDGADNWFSGSGTIIDPKGIILTNRHVVDGAYKNICFIGFLDSINKDPNFGPDGNPNLAEVKYITTTKDMDAAVLYLDNKNNKIYPYVNIWNSNSNSLKFGDKIEVVGYPSIGGSTITYTSGDFSGFGSQSDGTQNYIKTNVVLEHGNSGGSAYNQKGSFIGIPSMVVAGTLNSISYILSVDSIKNWLSGFLGNNYKQEIIEQLPVIVESPKVDIQSDITPPRFNLDRLCYAAYENDVMTNFARCFLKNQKRSEEFNDIQFYWNELNYKRGNEYSDVYDENGIKGYYYYFGQDLTVDPIKSGQYVQSSTFLNAAGARQQSMPRIKIEKEGTYYFILRVEDLNGNFSNTYIYEYVYEKNNHKTIENFSFYKDKNLKYFVKGYNANYYNEPRPGEHHPLECRTKLKNLTVRWEYPINYDKYVTKFLNSHDGLQTISVKGDEVNGDKYTFSNLNLGKKINWVTDFHKPDYSDYNRKDVYYEFFLKPVVSNNNLLDYHHEMIKIIYDPKLNEDLTCKNTTIFLETKEKPIVYNESINNKFNGKILLQVESHGEAWYVNPKTGKRHYMANGDEAYKIMRFLGTGITSKDLDKINNDKNFAKKYSGKIFLQTEAHGEAYYIDFNGMVHYLKDGAAAYTIMRELGLGITNNDLSKIPEGKLN